MEINQVMRLAFPGLLASLSEGLTVVTPTPLLSAVALEHFNRAQVASGYSAWQRPNIAHLGEWMTSCWQQARFTLRQAPLLLSLSQERELWRQIIEQDRPGLFNIHAMAGLAQHTSALMAEYQITSSGETWSQNPDAEAFLRWRTLLQRRLKMENWITRSSLWTLIPEWHASAVIAPGPVIFAPLSSVSPGLMRLRQQVAGITMSPISALVPASSFESSAQEFERAARTARHLIETRGVTSVGVLVCDLQSHSLDVERIFKEVFYLSQEEGSHFHIRSEPLLSHPLIANALLLLELAKPRIAYASAAAILRSPFIEGNAKERSARALAANKLARARELDFAFFEIRSVSRLCPLLDTVLHRVEKALLVTGAPMPLANWSNLFNEILEAARWPAIADLTESEQHAANAWNDALSELASLSLVAPDVSLSDAVARLRNILDRPNDLGNWSSPVQVLDASSCQGIEFEHTLILNASQEAWPPSVRLTPLIPYPLQRAHRVPGANLDALSEDRKRATRFLCASAARVDLSFTETLAPLFRPYVNLTAEPALQLWKGLTAAQSHPPAALDSQVDDAAPPLTQTDTFKGGAGVIRSQSQCPFRAFAEYRLLARGDDEACFGFDPLERGGFLHKALELVWGRLQNQSALKSISTAGLQALIQVSVSEALGEREGGPVYHLAAGAERERLSRVLSDWLAIERDRPVPFSVQLMEDERTIELSGLKLNLRIDRIDRLPNGRLILIDYKSGKQSKTKLEGNRPNEPQLLVYAASLDEPVDGLYFAEVRNREPRAVGHAAAKHFETKAVKHHKADWADFLQDSKHTVYRLAREFKDGRAVVDPTKSACEYCKIKPLCRIKTAGSSGDGEEEED